MENHKPKDPIDFENVVEAFNHALTHKLRGHGIANSFLDYWVPDTDPIRSIAGMADSARLAGHQDITIQFQQTTVPEQRLWELKAAIARFATVELEHEEECIVLRATEMAQTSADVETKRRVGNRHAKSPWQAEMAAAPEPAPAHDWDDSTLPEHADAHPHFRDGLKAAFASLSHEGMSDNVDQTLVRVEGNDGATGLILDIEPDTTVVRRAKHTGATAPSERAALDLFCRVAEGLPLQEVADHVGLKILEQMLDEDKPRPCEGILLPSNAGTPFTLAPRLARRAFETYRRAAELDRVTNFYNAPPPETWQALSAAERQEKIVAGIRAFLQSEGLYPDDIELLRLERNKYNYEVRIVVGFSVDVGVDRKPSLMRRLERRLRRDLEVDELELVADRAKDTSPLRRLS